MKRFTLVEVVYALALLIIFSCVIGWLFIQPYFEMKAFNKFSTKKATYWDAVFSQLRIQAKDGE